MASLLTCGGDVVGSVRARSSEGGDKVAAALISGLSGDFGAAVGDKLPGEVLSMVSLGDNSRVVTSQHANSAAFIRVAASRKPLSRLLLLHLTG